MRKAMIAIAVVAFLATGCTNTIPFSNSIRHQYKLNEGDLKSIQYYVAGGDIILSRMESTGEKTTSGGELEVKRTEKLEQVIIKQGTPGVVEKVIDAEKILVRFGDGHGENLVFNAHPKYKGIYVLQPYDWEKGRMKVSYGDKWYLAARGSEDIFLVIKMKSLRQVEREQKVVKGQKIG